MSFGLLNHVSGKTAEVTEQSPDLTPYLYGGKNDPKNWHDCSWAAGDNWETEEVRELKWRYEWCWWRVDAETGYFAINQSWTCVEKDWARP